MYNLMESLRAHGVSSLKVESWSESDPRHKEASGLMGRPEAQPGGSPPAGGAPPPRPAFLYVKVEGHTIGTRVGRKQSASDRMRRRNKDPGL